MRLSTSTCMYFNRPDGTKADIPSTIKIYSEAGYDVLDMNFHDCAMFETPMWGKDWKSYVEKIKNEADKYGIEFSQSHSHFYNYCEEQSEDSLWREEQIKRDIIGSEMLGVKWVVIHAATDWNSVTQQKSSKQKGIEYFRRLSDFAGKHNVGIAIENLWEMNIAPKRRYCSFAEELVDLVDSIDSENVGICWDFEHSAIMKQNQIDALKLVGDRLKATHISDYYDKVYDHVLPYNGISDVDDMLKSIAQLDYEGDFTFETHRHTMRLPDELVLPAIRYSRELGEYLIDRCNKFKEGLII